jgi:hypothetical protein
MRTMMLLVLMSLGLSFGCTSEVGQLPDETAGEDVEQAEQEINISCF